MKQKKGILALLLIFTFTFFAFPQDSKDNTVKEKDKPASDNLIKRKVAIVPVYNATKQRQYDYLTTNILDSLNAALKKTDSFELLDSQLVKEKITEKNIDTSGFVWQDTAIKIGTATQCDIVVFGFFQISNKDKIEIYLNALDVAAREAAITLEIDGKMGLNVINIVNNITRKMATQMKTQLPPYKRGDLNRGVNFNFTQKKLTGMALTIAGGLSFLTGMVLFIYDMTGYTEIVQMYKFPDDVTQETYDQFMEKYTIHLALFISSVTLMTAGATLLSIGIPFMVMKNKKMTFNITLKKNIELSLNYRF